MAVFFNACLAQLVEHMSCKHKVASSSLATSIKIYKGCEIVIGKMNNPEDDWIQSLDEAEYINSHANEVLFYVQSNIKTKKKRIKVLRKALYDESKNVKAE